MPTFVYKGRNRLNELVTGEKDATSQDELRALLRRDQIVMTQATEKGTVSIPKLGRRKKVGAKELAVFTRQFSVMIDAGLPLVQCIDILAEQQKNVYFKDVLHQVRQNVEEGSTLYAALQRHPKVFDALYTIKTKHRFSVDLPCRRCRRGDCCNCGYHGRRDSPIRADLYGAARCG
ncbi:MAG: type II secretion system F family protein [Acidobacteria bacterium]|nr:type II secretion system F family protein [Acidobacteriota bacterium]